MAVLLKMAVLPQVFRKSNLSKLKAQFDETRQISYFLIQILQTCAFKQTQTLIQMLFYVNNCINEIWFSLICRNLSILSKRNSEKSRICPSLLSVILCILINRIVWSSSWHLSLCPPLSIILNPMTLPPVVVPRFHESTLGLKNLA